MFVSNAKDGSRYAEYDKTKRIQTFMLMMRNPLQYGGWGGRSITNKWMRSEFHWSDQIHFQLDLGVQNRFLGICNI